VGAGSTKTLLELAQIIQKRSKTILGFKPEIIDVVVDKSNQIYVLGSKQDIEGFKNFVTQPPNN